MTIPADDLICADSFCANAGEPIDTETCDSRHAQPPHGPFRDGRVFVLTSKCPTCIYRPGNLMDLTGGVREAMEVECVRQQAPISCHKTLDGPRSVCRGYYDVHRHDIIPLMLAEAMGLIEFDEPPTEQ